MIKKKKVNKRVINVVEDKNLDVKQADVLLKKPVKTINKSKFKRLFFDIETSPNIVASWRVGYNLQIGPENILQERAIICICYKWANESKVHSLTWSKGNDKQMLVDFMKIMNSADEIIGHNSDKFDIRWVKTRALIHGIDHFPQYQTVDTLKLAKGNYLFNSNKLDYIGKVLGVGQKMDAGGFKTWKSIFIDHDQKALDKMVKYCKIDVIRLQQIYEKMNPFTPHKTHVAVALGKTKHDCPNCGSSNVNKVKTRYLATGTTKQQNQCKVCHKYYSFCVTKK
jgi:DNA polymerase elongation subunit (family B)